MSVEDLKRKKRKKELGSPQVKSTTTEMSSGGDGNDNAEPSSKDNGESKNLHTPSENDSKAVPRQSGSPDSKTQDKSSAGNQKDNNGHASSDDSKKNHDSSSNDKDNSKEEGKSSDNSGKDESDEGGQKDKSNKNESDDANDESDKSDKNKSKDKPDKGHDEDKSHKNDESDKGDRDAGNEEGNGISKKENENTEGDVSPSDDVSKEASDSSSGDLDAGQSSDVPSGGAKQLGEGAADVSQEAGGAVSNAGQTASAAGNTVNAAAGGAEAAGAAAGASGAPVVTPQDMKDIKDLDVKGDAKQLGNDLKKGDLNGIAKNKSLNKAAETAAKVDPTGTSMAVNAGLKVAQNVDLNALKKGDVAGAAKSLKDNVSENPQALFTGAEGAAGQNPEGTAGADGEGMPDGEDEPDIRDMDDGKSDIGGDDKDDADNGKDDIEKDGTEGKEDSSENDGADTDKDKDTGDEENGKKEGDEAEEDGGDKEDGAEGAKDKEKSKENLKKAVQATSNAASTVASVAPYAMAIQAAYAFAQFLYMLFMSLIQAVAQAASWFITLLLNIWAGITGFFSNTGAAIAGAFGISATTTQSAIVGATATAVAVATVAVGASALRYNLDMQTMLASDQGVTISVGCTEAQKGALASLKEALTGDPVMLGDEQMYIAEQVMAVMMDSSLPVNQTESPNNMNYVYGVLANAYAESGLSPFAIENNPTGTALNKIMNADGTLKSTEKLTKNHTYVTETARDSGYQYGIGLFQFTSYRNAFLDFCYDETNGLVAKTTDYKSPIEEGDGADLSKYSADWYTLGAQMSYMIAYPVKVPFFTQAYDTTALEKYDIKLEEIDYAPHLPSVLGEITDDDIEACRASTLFLGVYEVPKAFTLSTDSRDDVIYRRAAMAVSIAHKYKNSNIEEKISANSTWAASVINRVTASGEIATIDAISSGYTNCGMNTAAWNLDSPAAVAVTYSHPELNELAEQEATPIYKYIVGTLGDTFGDAMSTTGNFASCDRGVAYAYRVSGWDTTIPLGGVDEMRDYLESSERWENVKTFPYSEANTTTHMHPDVDTAEKRKDVLQPGDILIDYCEHDKGLHVYMYVDNDVVLNVKGITEEELQLEKNQVYQGKEMVEASYHEYYPSLQKFHLYGNPDSRDAGTGGTLVFRCKNPEGNTQYRDIIRYGAPSEDESEEDSDGDGETEGEADAA